MTLQEETKKIIKFDEVKEIGIIEKKLLESGFLPNDSEDRIPELLQYYRFWYKNTPKRAKQTRMLYGSMIYMLQTLQSYNGDGK